MKCQGRAASEDRTMSRETTKSNTSAGQDPRHTETEIDTGTTQCCLSPDGVGSLPSAAPHSNSNILLTKSNTSAEEDPGHSETEIDTGVTQCCLSPDGVGSLPTAAPHSNSNVFGTEESLDKGSSLEICNNHDDVNLSAGHRSSGSGRTNVHPSKHTNIREANFCTGKTLRQLQKQQGGPCYPMQSECRSIASGQAIHDGSCFTPDATVGIGTLTTATSLPLSSFGSDISPLSNEQIYWKQETVLYQAKQRDSRQKSSAAESVEASCSGDCSQPETDGAGEGAELKPGGIPRRWLGNKSSQYCMERERRFVPGEAVSGVIRAGDETRASIPTNRQRLGFVSCFETVVTADPRQYVRLLQRPSFVPLRLQFERRVPCRSEHLRSERRTPLFLPN